MKDEIRQEITKVLTDLGIEVIKFVEDSNQDCSDPIRIWIKNVPSDWDEIGPYIMDEVEDELHTVLNKHFSNWEIVEMNGLDDGVTGSDEYAWVLHGELKD